MRCPACRVRIEGRWTRCPLCGGATDGTPSPDPLPTVPLVFSRRRLLRVLLLVSLGVIVASFAVQLLLGAGSSGIGVLRSVWLGLSTLWLLTLIAVRERREVTRVALYLVLLVCPVCVYWDYLTGWHGWSLTYTLPIVSACAVIAVLVTARLLRIELGDHVLHSGPTVLMGLTPLVLLALGWVTDPLPSVLCVIVSLVALSMLHLSRIRDVRHELARRLHL
ncbi:DUF6320 domain-containing protein [Brachybacterium sp. AOP25-B2-12]|uniref:DUF6320 domain-containing protein n=1 Tax=Brachybacterium sp. AOP25-B2-12 TaxID=3457710 RepID=UPI004034F53C